MGKDDKMLSLISTGLTYTDSEEIIAAKGVSPLATKSLKVDEKGRVGSFEGVWDEMAKAMEGGTNKITASAAVVTDGFATVGEAAIDLVDSLVSGAQSLQNWFSGTGVPVDNPNKKTNQVHTK